MILSAIASLPIYIGAGIALAILNPNGDNTTMGYIALGIGIVGAGLVSNARTPRQWAIVCLLAFVVCFGFAAAFYYITAPAG